MHTWEQEPSKMCLLQSFGFSIYPSAFLLAGTHLCQEGNPQITISIHTSALFQPEPQVLPSQHSTVLFSCHCRSCFFQPCKHIAGYFYFSLTVSCVSD